MTLPTSIDDAVTRALRKLVDRWQERIETERVLAWHLASVEESALPHVADSLGSGGIRYIDAPPRSLLREAIKLRKIRGTDGCLWRVLLAIGLAGTLEANTVLRYDGSITHRGEPWRYGMDRSWAVGRLWVDVDGPLSLAASRELRDAVAWAIPRHVAIVIVVREAGGTWTTYRD